MRIILIFGGRSLGAHFNADAALPLRQQVIVIYRRLGAGHLVARRILQLARQLLIYLDEAARRLARLRLQLFFEFFGHYQIRRLIESDGGDL